MNKPRYEICAHAYDKRGRLLAVGTNSYTKTHPLQAYFAKKVGHYGREFMHAELACLLRCKDKPVHTLRVFRYNQNGELQNAKPCVICQEMFKAFDVRHIYFSTLEGWKEL